ncbi:MAG: triose-phosphate isomerase [Oscillospiraceae bacterium]|nr:triose-phosphate isomerase [Oscillospiraceae bacterium]
MNIKYRQTIIAGNWKMNTLASGAKSYANALCPLIPGFYAWCNVVICAPFTSIHAVVHAFKGNKVSAGAQNMSEHKSGAYTGEVSGEQLRDIGAEYVIIGHSERRQLYGETDESVNSKILAALEVPLHPILCVGESLEERESGVTTNIVSAQIKNALASVPDSEISRVVVAYEPIWAIGTGKTASPEDAQDTCREIRAVLANLYDAELAQRISILYGGSMNEKNAAELLAQPDIDGGLVGGASLNPTAFAEIINAAKGGL